MCDVADRRLSAPPPTTTEEGHPDAHPAPLAPAPSPSPTSTASSSGFCSAHPPQGVGPHPPFWFGAEEPEHAAAVLKAFASHLCVEEVPRGSRRPETFVGRSRRSWLVPKDTAARRGDRRRRARRRRTGADTPAAECKGGEERQDPARATADAATAALTSASTSAASLTSACLSCEGVAPQSVRSLEYVDVYQRSMVPLGQPMKRVSSHRLLVKWDAFDGLPASIMLLSDGSARLARALAQASLRPGHSSVLYALPEFGRAGQYHYSSGLASRVHDVGYSCAADGAAEAAAAAAAVAASPSLVVPVAPDEVETRPGGAGVGVAAAAAASPPAAGVAEEAKGDNDEAALLMPPQLARHISQSTLDVMVAHHSEEDDCAFPGVAEPRDRRPSAELAALSPLEHPWVEAQMAARASALLQRCEAATSTSGSLGASCASLSSATSFSSSALSGRSEGSGSGSGSSSDSDGGGGRAVSGRYVRGLGGGGEKRRREDRLEVVGIAVPGGGSGGGGDGGGGGGGGDDESRLPKISHSMEEECQSLLSVLGAPGAGAGLGAGLDELLLEADCGGESESNSSSDDSDSDSGSDSEDDGALFGGFQV